MKKSPRNGEGFGRKSPRRRIDYPKEEHRHDESIKGKRDRKKGGIPKTPDVKTLNSGKKDEKCTRKEEKDLGVSFSPVSPEQPESRKRKREYERRAVTRTMALKDKDSQKKKAKKKGGTVSKKRVYYKKVVYDEGEFEVGNDVYVRRREDASSDDEDPQVEECRVCFKSGKAVMIECDDCLYGFHLKCLKPPLKEVPDGDWICGFCEARKMGKEVQLPMPPKGKKLARTMREKLLSSDLWAARIDR